MLHRPAVFFRLMARLRRREFGKSEVAIMAIAALIALGLAAFTRSTINRIERNTVTKVTERITRERATHDAAQLVTARQVIARCDHDKACRRDLHKLIRRSIPQVRTIVRTETSTSPAPPAAGKGPQGAQGAPGAAGTDGQAGTDGRPGVTKVIHTLDSSLLDGVDNRVTDVEHLINALTAQVGALSQKLVALLAGLCRLHICL